MSPNHYGGGGGGGVGQGVPPPRSPGDFYRSTIFSLARCLAQIPNVDWAASVRDPLFSQCPQEDAQGNWNLSENGQDAVLALGIFFLESQCQCGREIVPYLLRVEAALVRANISQRQGFDQRKSCYFVTDMSSDKKKCRENIFCENKSGSYLLMKL